MNTTPLLKFLFVLILGTMLSSTALGQDKKTFPDIDESPFKEDAGLFSDSEGREGGSARSRARRRTSNRAPREFSRRTDAQGNARRQFPDSPFPTRPDEDLGDEESDQQTILSDQYAGWREASDGLGARRIGENLRANWVMVGPTGVLEGTVRSIDSAETAGMTVYLMNQGRLVKTAAVQEDGSFSFNNVRRGSYSLIGWGDRAFFAFGANVLGYSEDADDSTPTFITTYAFQNSTTINTDWIRYFTPNVNYRIYGKFIPGEGPEDPQQLYGVSGLTNFYPQSIPSTSVGGTPVSLTTDGRLIGRVHQMRSSDGRPIDVRSTKVMLLKRDSVVASTTTDNFGVFEFEEVPPGGYGLLAAGVDGVGLTGLQVVGGDSLEINDDGELADADADGEPFDFCLTSAETAGWLNHYAVEVAYQRSILAPRPPRPREREFGEGDFPMANGRRPAPARCSARDLSFAEWQQLGCACYQSNGLLGVGRGVRRITDRLDQAIDRAFYPDLGTGGISGFNGQPLGTGGGFQQRGVGGSQQPVRATFSDQVPTANFSDGSGTRAPVGGSGSRN